MKSKKGFTLIELMVVVLIVGILAAVAIPILRGRIDAAKWTEGKTMMGSIATAIRAYAAEKGATGDNPTTLFGTGATSLGFAAGYLTGTYFHDDDFTDPPTADITTSPITFLITCAPVTQDERPSNPGQYTLNQLGAFIGSSTP